MLACHSGFGVGALMLVSFYSRLCSRSRRVRWSFVARPPQNIQYRLVSLSNQEREKVLNLDELKDHNRSGVLGAYYAAWKKFADCIVLMQVGSFYEAYGKQATLVSSLLNIALTNKPSSLIARNPVQLKMTGFPDRSEVLQRHLNTLVNAGYKIVVMNQRQVQSKAKTTMFERYIERIVTPGTGIDDAFVARDTRNYLAAVALHNPSTVGVAFYDCSSGVSYERLTTADQLEKVLTEEADLREVVFDISNTDKALLSSVPLSDGFCVSHLSQRSHVISDNALRDAKDIAIRYILQCYPTLSYDDLDSGDAPDAIVEQTTNMIVPQNVLRALEVLRTATDSTRGTLFSVMNETHTPNGHRLLRDILKSPSTDLVEINRRHAIVQSFVDDPDLRDDFVMTIRGLDDVESLVHRIQFKRASSRDILAVLDILERQVALTKKFFPESLPKNHPLKLLLAKLNNLPHLSEAIRSVLEGAANEENEEPEDADAVSDSPAQDPDAVNLQSFSRFYVNRRATPQLSSLHSELDQVKRQKHKLEAVIRKQYFLDFRTQDVLTVSLKSGPIVSIPRQKAEKAKNLKKTIVLEPFDTKSNRSLFTCSQWTSIYGAQDDLLVRIRLIEQEILQELQQIMRDCLPDLHRNAAVLSELDVHLSFATSAQKHGLVRPVMTTDTKLSINNAWHIGLHESLRKDGAECARNDTFLDTSKILVQFITGPNMAGKSTYLRQVGLIVLLAQCGSFVPAEAATIGIVDHIFTRVGLHDQLNDHQSTFKVEMVDMADLFEYATDKSLFIVDEIGRGTSPSDGEALAYASLRYLAQERPCRGLFASHFHNVGTCVESEPEYFPNVSLFQTHVIKTPTQVTYTHKIVPGMSTDSMGLSVALDSGVPRRVIDHALAYQKREK